MTKGENKFRDEIESLKCWSYFDENGPSESHLKQCCIMYERWAYSKVSKREEKNSLLPTPQEWVDDKEAMEQFKTSMILDEHTGEEFIYKLRDSKVQTKAKNRIRKQLKNDYHLTEKKDIDDKTNEFWFHLTLGHGLGAKLLRAFNTL